MNFSAIKKELNAENNSKSGSAFALREFRSDAKLTDFGFLLISAKRGKKGKSKVRELTTVQNGLSLLRI